MLIMEGFFLQVACISKTSLPSCLSEDQIRLDILSDSLTTALEVTLSNFNLGLSLSEECPIVSEVVPALMEGVTTCGLAEYRGAVEARRRCGEEAVKAKEERLSILELFPTAR